MNGRAIVIASWASLAVYTVVAVPDAAGAHSLGTAAAVIGLGLFLVSLPIWLYAFGVAIVRSARGDDIAVGSWVFLVGSAPAPVRRQLLGATAASVVIGLATAWANAFGVLVPMLPLGLAALWGARHGTYPPRAVPAVAKGGRR